MKPMTQEKLKKKYENKKRYLMHYQLMEQMTKGWGIMLRLNVCIFVVFYLFWREYPIALATLDFTFTVLCIIFLLAVKPNMLRGKMSAYYRRDYGKMKVRMFLIQFFIQGGFMRFPVLFLFYGLSIYLVRDNPMEVAQYKEVVLSIMINPTVSAIAIGAFVLTMYLLFYQERYTSIREFSNEVVEIFSKSPYNEEGAVQEFIRRKDEQLELIDINGVKYDGAWSKNVSTTHTEIPLKETNRSESGEAVVSDVHEPPTDTVRRKARR